jgi:hypothetical protein
VPAVVLSIHETAEGQLLDVVQAIDALRFQFRRIQNRQKQGRENADDGNDDEQFNQRESAARGHVQPENSKRDLVQEIFDPS